MFIYKKRQKIIIIQFKALTKVLIFNKSVLKKTQFQQRVFQQHLRKINIFYGYILPFCIANIETPLYNRLIISQQLVDMDLKYQKLAQKQSIKHQKKQISNQYGSLQLFNKNQEYFSCKQSNFIRMTAQNSQSEVIDSIYPDYSCNQDKKQCWQLFDQQSKSVIINQVFQEQLKNKKLPKKSAQFIQKKKKITKTFYQKLYKSITKNEKADRKANIKIKIQHQRKTKNIPRFLLKLIVKYFSIYQCKVEIKENILCLLKKKKGIKMEYICDILNEGDNSNQRKKTMAKILNDTVETQIIQKKQIKNKTAYIKVTELFASRCLQSNRISSKLKSF